MACFHPLKAFQLEDGKIVFSDPGDARRDLELPCGQCVGCRLERSRQWAVRIMHESQMHDTSLFVTLTYDDEHLESYSLVYRDFQLFMKKLRKYFDGKGVRFYMCGEYGDNFGRPHFHVVLFGCFFDDREFFTELSSGSKLYTSKALAKLWGKGFCSIGDVTFESAAYVARYVMKKMTGTAAEQHYQLLDERTGEVIDRVPEFCRMSLKPGIGADWYEKFKKEVYPRDEVVMNGSKFKPPRYYDKRFDKDESFPMASKFDVELRRGQRIQDADPADRSVARLLVREACTKARLSFKPRGLK